MQLLSRDEFHESIFKRDRQQCVNCSVPATAAHHIIERKIFKNGGYFLDNGVALWDLCHIKAEQTILTCEELRAKAGIKEVILPDGFDPAFQVDKWGNQIIPPNFRKPGPLYPSETGMINLLRQCQIYFIIQ